MKILELSIENIKRIKTVNIKPGDGAVILEGKNAQGKSSALDSIAMALGGKTLIPENPIRNGEETAEIKVDLGDYVVTRHWTKGGATHLKLENKDGMKATSPQKMLDALVGDLSFDPMAFCNMEKAKRVELLKRVAGLDFTDLEKEYRDKYDTRRLANRGLKEFEVKLKDYEGCEDPGEIPTASEIKLKLENARNFNKEINEAGALADELRSEVAANNQAIDRKKEMIASLQEDIEKINGSNKKLETRVAQLIEQGSEKPIDTSDLEKELENIKALKEQKEKFSSKQFLQKEYDSVVTEVTMLNDRLQEIEDEKNKLVSEANLPVPGLDFLNGDVSYNGVEFAQASTAEQIKVSMAIAMALNPKIRIVRIMNGSLLDKGAMDEIVAIAKKNDFQVWVERVSDEKSGNTIYIEDGEIVG